jgi:hypothetical protein
MRVAAALVSHPAHVPVRALVQELAQSVFGEWRGVWRGYSHGVEAVFARGLAQRCFDTMQVGQKSRSA